VFPKAPDRIEILGVIARDVREMFEGSSRITIRKMFDAERKELTDDMFSPVNIL
jgi:hypothetical protein